VRLRLFRLQLCLLRQVADLTAQLLVSRSESAKCLSDAAASAASLTSVLESSREHSAYLEKEVLRLQELVDSTRASSARDISGYQLTLRKVSDELQLCKRTAESASQQAASDLSKSLAEVSDLKIALRQAGEDIQKASADSATATASASAALAASHAHSAYLNDQVQLLRAKSDLRPKTPKPLY